MEKILEDLCSLLQHKGKYYGDTFGTVPKLLRILYESRRNEQGQYVLDDKDWDNMVAVVRVLDKMCRIVAGDRGEESAWRDIVGYAILSLNRVQSSC